jgi:hypothetical protein
MKEPMNTHMVSLKYETATLLAGLMPKIGNRGSSKAVQHVGMGADIHR